MITKILKSNRGSTLLFVLIAITVLSLLGVSLMSLALSGFKVKLSERDAKESQYLSESGLDQSFILASNVVKSAIEAGKAEIDAFINNKEPSAEEEDSLEKFIGTQRENEIKGIEDSPYIDGTNGKGPVNEEELKKKINEKFKKRYKDYVDENLTDTLEDDKNYKKMYEDGSKPEISWDEDRYVNFEYGGDISVITLVSKYKLTDGTNEITKEIAVDFRIEAPDYDQEYTVETVSEVNSPLFDKVLAADGNIIVKGTGVSIKGDVFAGGDSSDDDSFGLTLGEAGTNTQGSLSVDGRIFTGGDIRINSNNSSLEAYGDIYCSNIRFRDVTSGSVKVGSAARRFNLHTLNGIILDGSRSTVDIHGKYYGFSRGMDADVSRSTILINDQYPDVSGTHINITGEETPNDKFPDGTGKPLGNVIAGSNFVPLGLTRAPDAEGRYYQVLYQTW
ncbi:MAG TPA: pilus assembly PilX N-terminal domain-containing protein, partial [Candidatus Nitrosocosmicus sp.]|nr:pilus assembly PilX N-terminal domain-containing protein [Candidatus Nitrosocosmicus sp.]